jgi:hypothetical protein
MSAVASKALDEILCWPCESARRNCRDDCRTPTEYFLWVQNVIVFRALINIVTNIFSFFAICVSFVWGLFVSLFVVK